MKKYLLSFIFCVVALSTSFSAAAVAGNWLPAIDNPDIYQVNDLNTTLSVYSDRATSDSSLTEYTDGWVENPDDANQMRLTGMGVDVVGQSVTYKGVSFGSAYTGPAIDIKMTVENVVMANNTTGEPEYISLDRRIGGLNTLGYTRLDMNVQFLDPATGTPVIESPIMNFTDIDGDQVAGADADAIVQKDSILTTLEGGDQNYFSNHLTAGGADQNAWALFDFGETSSYNFTWGMNRLDPDGTSNRSGGYTGLDIRMRQPSAQIELDKVDQDGNPLAGAEFSVVNTLSGAEVASLTTDADGHAITPSIPLADYTVTETKAPEGYVMDTTPYDANLTTTDMLLKINSGNAVVNKLITGQLDVNKVDQDGNPLAGVEFTIYDADGTEVETITTDATGHAISSTLDYGKYTVKETKGLAGYQTNDTVYDANIDVDGEVETINSGNAVVNNWIDGQIELNKVDEDGNALAGVEFTIYDADGTEVETITTDASGHAISSVLDGGDYTVKETATLEGLVLDDTVYPASITTPDQVVTLNSGDAIVNKTIRGQIEIKKIDQDGAPLAGAEFTIYDATGAAVETITTDASGKATSSALAYGDYTVKETKAPVGYTADTTTEYPASITTDGEVVKLNGGDSIINVLITGQIELNKVDQDGNALAGAEFTIYDADGKAVETITTDADGYAISSTLAYGDYTVSETKAPVGYVADTTTKYPASIKTDGEVVAVNSGEAIVNTLITGQVELNKVDQDGNALAGVEFTIKDSDGNDVEVLTTDDKGYAISSQLGYGEYKLVETKALDGYKLDGTAYDFAITTDGEVATVNGGEAIVNYKEDTNIVVPSEVTPSETTSSEVTPSEVTPDTTEETSDAPMEPTTKVERVKATLATTGLGIASMILAAAAVVLAILVFLKYKNNKA